MKIFVFLLAEIFCLNFNPLKSQAKDALKAAKINFFQTQKAAMLIQEIPKPQGKYRLMTYNTENLKRPDLLMDTIRKGNPTAVSMQEVPMTKFNEFAKKMDAEGFKYFAKCENIRLSGKLANVIFSKVPITKQNGYNLKDPYGNRCVVEAVIGSGANQLMLMGTHLTNAKGNYRAVQMNQINELSTLRKSQGFSNQIILADFNTEKNNIAMNNFKDSLDHTLGAKEPPMTQWRGKTIDFAMVTDDLAANAKFHNHGFIASDGSDHLPVFVDLSPGALSKLPTGDFSAAKMLFPEPHLERAKEAGKNVALVAGGVGLIGSAVVLSEP